jgi:hypothetical protein
MKKTWIIILSTILAIVVVLQIAVMVFLNSTGIHIISKYARFNTGGKGYVYNTVTKEWERENISWYIDLLVRNKKADGVLSVEDYGKLTGNRPVISVDMSKDFCKIFFYATVTKYNENGGIEDLSTIVLSYTTGKQGRLLSKSGMKMQALNIWLMQILKKMQR